LVSNTATDVHKPAWPQAEMSVAIRRYRDSGDPQACLDLLGVERADRALIVLQAALLRAQSHEERDCFEEIAFDLTCGARRRDPSTAHEVKSRAAQWYGENVGDFVEVDELLRGLLPAGSEAPTTAAAVAAIGMELARVVRNPLHTSKREAGRQIVVTHTNCPDCDIALGADGYVLCRQCLDRARAQVRRGDFSSTVLSGDALAARALIELPERFGCAHCNNTPARVCACRRSVTVPHEPRDGQLVCGQRELDSSPCWFTITLEE